MHPDLFNQSANDWIADPRKTFDAWLSARHFRGSSADVYRAQWHHFLDWLAERQKTLVTINPAVIDEFVATLDVKRQQRARYLRIMERVFDDMFQEAPAAGNPARPVARSIDAPWADTSSNAPTGFLSATEQAALWAELMRAVVHKATMHWRDSRDRALAAVLLGTGLKLSEADSLKLSAIDLKHHTLLVEADNPLYNRTVPLPVHKTANASAIVAQWLEARRDADIPGDLVFPAGRGGKVMHKATVLRAIDALVEQSGVIPERGARISPQTLRNAYAATLFDAGESDELLAERLGFAQVLSSKRLRQAWSDWQTARARSHAIQEAVKASARTGVAD